ncbi:MAG: DUF134 domain-containing protein [Ignavibacteriae bacterium]|nr:DUF134 domain-containing protein [Ignavibacteriota bacterium]
MARPVKPRKLLIPHRNISFVPEGDSVQNAESITLLSEEYETIKLVDYERMNHLEAANILHVSRSTLTRIYEKARKKIAECLVEGKTLKLSGGNSIYIENWFRCEKCNSIFNIPDKKRFGENCPVCSSVSIKSFQKSDLKL